MIYHDEWCVLHIPRTSGTNFKANAVLKYNNRVKLPYYKNTVKDRLQQHNPLSSFDIGSRQSYAIVRHPYTRALSLYNYALNDKEFLKLFDKVSFREFWDLDISEFCDWSLKDNQYEFMAKDTVWFKLEDSLSKLYAATKVPLYKKFINSSIASYETHYSKENKDIVENIFKEDYYIFNY